MRKEEVEVMEGQEHLSLRFLLFCLTMFFSVEGARGVGQNSREAEKPG